MNETTPGIQPEAETSVQMNPLLHEAWADAQSSTMSAEAQEQLFTSWRINTAQTLEADEQDDFAVASDIIHWSMFPHAHNELPKGLVYVDDGETWSISYASTRARWALQNTLLKAEDLFGREWSVNAARRESYRHATDDDEEERGTYHEALKSRIDEMPVMQFLRSLDTEGQGSYERPLTTGEQLVMRSALTADAQRRFGALTTRAENPAAARQYYANESLIEEARVTESRNTEPRTPQQALRTYIAKNIEEQYLNGITIDPATLSIGLGMQDELSVAFSGRTSDGSGMVVVKEVNAIRVVKDLIHKSDGAPHNRIVAKRLEDAIKGQLPNLMEASGEDDPRQQYRKALEAIKYAMHWEFVTFMGPDNLQDLVPLNARTILFDTPPPGELIDTLEQADRHYGYGYVHEVVPQFVSAETFSETAPRIKANFVHPPEENVFIMPTNVGASAKQLSPNAIASGAIVINAGQSYTIPGYELQGWVPNNEAYVYTRSNLPTVPHPDAMRLDRHSLVQYFTELGAKDVARSFEQYREPTIVDLVQTLKAHAAYAIPDRKAKESLDPENNGIIFDGSRFITQCSGMACYLADLLQGQGYAARPVGGYSAKARQKNISANDLHAVVEVEIDGEFYYFDATPSIAGSPAVMPAEQGPQRFRDKVRGLLGRVALKLRLTNTEQFNEADIAAFIGNPAEVMAQGAPSLSEETTVEYVARPEFQEDRKLENLSQNRTQCETYLAGYFGVGNVDELHSKMAAAVRQGNQEAVIAQRVLQIVARSAPRFEGSVPVDAEEVRQLQSTLKKLAQNDNLPQKYAGMSPGLIAGLRNSLDKAAESVTFKTT